MKLEKILQKYGLSTKQATIYLACLELGSASVYKISQKTGFPRSTCYEILDELLTIGLTTTFRKKNVKYFDAEDPRILMEKAHDRANMIEAALPLFQSRYGKNRNTPSVRLYQGKEQMKLVFNEILKEAISLYSIGSADDLFGELDFFPTFVNQRIKKKIPLKVILRDSIKARERQLLGRQELREVRLLSSNFEFNATMYLWKNKVAIFSLADDFIALVIEGTQTAKLQQTFFDYMWESLR